MTREPARTDLPRSALKGTLLYVAVLWVLVFLPAQTLAYWQGWLFWAHISLWSAIGTWYFLQRDPALVQRRMRAGPGAERLPSQRRIQLFLSILLCALLVDSVLDWRFAWSAVPASVVIAANVLLSAGYLLIFRVLRENSFAGSAIEVTAEQPVISTG